MLEERQHYQSDGGVIPAAVPFLIGLPLAAATALGWILAFAFEHDSYYIVIVPALAALALAAVLKLLINVSRCRNHRLAVTIAIVAGLVLYLGYYYFCLSKRLPIPFTMQMRLLPDYIVYRLKTDISFHVARPKGNQLREPSLVLNSIMLALELSLVLGFVVAAAWRRSRRAYCRELGRWMERETALLPGFFGSSFVEALENGKLAEFVASTPAGSSTQTAGRLVLEYAGETQRSASEYPIYVSVEDFATRALPARWRFRWATLRQAKLEPDEVLDLRPLFPKLTRLLELQHPEVRDLPTKVTALPGSQKPEEVAEVVSVPEAYRQRVRGRGYALRLMMRAIIPLIFLVGGIAVGAAGYYLSDKTSGALPALTILVGLLGVGWGLYVLLACRGVYECRYVDRRLRQEVRRRAEPWVDPADPESRYVYIVPRERFARVTLTLASDVLLLKIDTPERRVLMEGDTNRYRIPAGAIASCEPQHFHLPTDSHQRHEIWTIRLMVNFEQGLQELLFVIGHVRWRPMTNARREEQAEQMCERIKSL